MSADETLEPVPGRKRSLPFRIVKWLGIGIAALLALLLAIGFLLDTQIGKRFLVDQISAFETESGLRVEVGRIEGSIYTRSRLYDVRVFDPQRMFFEVPEVTLDWRPLKFLNNTLDIRSAVLERGELLAIPELRETESDARLLPEFDIRIGRLEANDLVIAKGIAGERQVAQIAGEADIRAGRALVDLKTTLEGGDDRLRVLLDAEPEANRLAANVDLNAPADGVIAALAGLERGIVLRVDGEGDWQAWNGRLRSESGGDRLAALRIGARNGAIDVRGMVWPEFLLEGLPADVTRGGVAVAINGSMDNSTPDGKVRLVSEALDFAANGSVDLSQNATEGLLVSFALRRPDVVPGVTLERFLARAQLEGAFDELEIDYDISAASFASAGLELTRPRMSGVAQWRGDSAVIPVAFTSTTIDTPNDTATGLLNGLSGDGEVVYSEGVWRSDGMVLRGKGASAVLDLEGDGSPAGYTVSGTVAVPRLALENLGTAKIDGRIRANFGGAARWRLFGGVQARLGAVENDTLTNVAGENIRLASQFRYGDGEPFLIQNARLDAANISATGNGRVEPSGRILASAAGRHTEYGPFDLEVDGEASGTSAVLNLESPFPALGLRGVRIALAPIEDGFGVDASGQSSLGPFSGDASIFAASEGRTLVRVNQLTVSKTSFAGDIYSSDAGISGNLAASGGGLDGFIRIAPRGGGQVIIADIDARNARFEGDTPLIITQGNVQATALLVEGRSDVDATVSAAGISRGNIFLGKIAANAKLVNGAGKVTASIAGRRGSRFELQTTADIAPNRVTVNANGNYGRREIETRGPAVLTRAGDGWRLAATQIGFGRGSVILSGNTSGGTTRGQFQMQRMPLQLFDIAFADLGLGGTASGTVDFTQSGSAAPTGQAKLRLRRLTRSGLVLTSRPIDVAVNASLTQSALALRGVAEADDATIGRFQARIAGMPSGGDFATRLQSGSLLGQLRYNGPADALWRLTGIEGFDFTGPVRVTADARGTLANPRVEGAVATDEARLDSPLSGTVVTGIRARGSFAGSVLTLANFSGKAPNGGDVTGSGRIDLAGSEGVAMDIDVEASNALILNRDDFAASATGPINIRSNGSGGTLSGNLDIVSGRFQLGTATAASELPNISYREVNRRADELPPGEAASPWRYDITARANNRVRVTGLGLDSEWGADVVLTGPVNEPRIRGRADLIRGDYTFAGRRFELERGRITFREFSPPDPRLDIEANADVSGINATINVRGTGLRPEITFSSVPALPEEEVLSRVVFGSSVTDISAAEAVQLAASLAALRGGGGLDPINQLRSAIGLDRLRIVGADAATGQGTSIAAGKYITRRVYVEVITDGRGYSATQAEFQITSWLSLLSSISTLGRESANVRISKDY